MTVDPSYMTVQLWRHKANQYGRGAMVVIGCTLDDLCPVTVPLAYLAQRPSDPGPLFIHADSAPLTRVDLVRAVQDALSDAGVDTSGYSGHSFHIGAATTVLELVIYSLYTCTSSFIHCTMLDTHMNEKISES